MKLVRHPDQKKLVWKNGLGFTTQILIHPDDATLETFHYRINTARVTGNEAFSELPRVDRTLFIVDGVGLRLGAEGAAAEDVRPDSPPFRFAGDQATPCSLIDGPVVDFNIMTRRGHATHNAVRLPTPCPPSVRVSGHPGMLFCYRGSVTVEHAGERLTLESHDAALTYAEAETWTIDAQAGALLFLVGIFPTARSEHPNT